MIDTVFGIPIKYEQWDKEKFLPFYMKENYSFQVAFFNDHRCIMLTIKKELATIPALKKHIKKIQELDNIPVIFSLSTISSYRRNSLMEKRIAFVTDKQIYLPFLGTLLLEQKEKEKKIEKFMFSTQQLVLLFLYNGKQELYMSEATKKLPFTAMTMSRAVRQLELTGLFTVRKDRVKKVIESNYGRLELFLKLKSYCFSPIRLSGYLEKTCLTEDMVIAGETALSKKTMLNPTKIETYAINHKGFDKTQLMKELVDPNKQIRVEVWEYDPKQFGSDNMADSLSVVLSLADNEDERIEEAIEELLKKELTE